MNNSFGNESMAKQCFSEAGFRVNTSYFPKNQGVRALQDYCPRRLTVCLEGLRRQFRDPELSLSSVSRTQINDNFLGIDFVIEFLDENTPYIFAVDVTALHYDAKKERVGNRENLREVYRSLGISNFISLSVCFTEDGWFAIEDFQQNDLIEQVYNIVESTIKSTDFLVYRSLDITLGYR